MRTLGINPMACGTHPRRGTRKLGAILAAATLATGFGVVSPPVAQAATVTIPDAKLAKCVQDELASLDPPATEMTTDNLARITRLNCDEVSDLTGIDALTGITELWLWYGEYTDLRPLAQLANLEEVHLDTFRNAGRLAGPKDLSPLSGLTKLRDLDVNNTRVSDLGPIAKLTELESLTVMVDNAGGGGVKDLAPLSGLAGLTFLNLYGNQISDLRPLSGLPQLGEMDLSWNRITDLAPLSGLAKLDTVHLDSNRIADLRPLRTVHTISAVDQQAALRVARGVPTQFPLFWKDGSHLTPKLPSGLKLSGGTITGTRLGTFTIKFSKGDSFAGKLTVTVARPKTLKPTTPKISGAAKVGITLTAEPGSWRPAPVELSYQWYRSGKKIPTATEPTYALVPADKGGTITVRVTGTKPGYATASRTSRATSAVR